MPLQGLDTTTTQPLDPDTEDSMQTIIDAPKVPIGALKSFGPFGPKYEVGHAIRQLHDGDWLIEVTMVESGEKAEYRLSQLNNDPEAH